MGQKHLRVVLDTNVIISSCIFGKKLSIICNSLESDKIILVFSESTLRELMKTITSSKFKLSKSEILGIEKMILPYSRKVKIRERLPENICRDINDIKFLECAIAGNADYLVTGDKDLLSIGEVRGIKIITPAQFIEIIEDI